MRFRVVVWLTGWRLLTLQITIQCAFSTFHAMLVSALSRLYLYFIYGFRHKQTLYAKRT